MRRAMREVSLVSRGAERAQDARREFREGASYLRPANREHPREPAVRESPRRVNHLFVTQDYGPDRGGMARRHVELCRRFGDARNSITVSTVDLAGAAAFDA